jgi:curved DNA-binding protein CbpA
MSVRGRGPVGGADRFFWELLGLQPGADRESIKRAYYRKARENHPDFFPEEQKALQEIRMISLNEAYACLMSHPGHRIEDRSGGEVPRRRAPAAPPTGSAAATPETGWAATPAGAAADSRGFAPHPGSAAPFPEAGWAPPGSGDAPGTAAVGFHKEPAYAYYKQGFVHFSRAIHGIEALYQSMARYPRIRFRPRDDAYERFAGSLVELRRAHDYFSRVVGEHGDSVWRRDAEIKLSRIERFSALYRRIIGNLTAEG